jgi:hypothetical protein
MRTALLKGHVFVVLLVTLLAGGCQSGRRVNLIASDEICRTPGNQLRQSARDYTCVVQFGQGSCKQTLTPDYQIQKVWRDRNAEYLFVLADLPGTFPDLPGNADARRVRLPALDSKCWGLQQREINISIESGKVVPLTISESKNCD